MDRLAAMKLIRDVAALYMENIPKPVPDGWQTAGQIVSQMILEATNADDDPAAKAALALEVAATAHVEGLMALSTSHVSKTTADHLQLNSLDVVRYEHGDYGWLIHVPSDEDFWAPVQANAQAREFPTDLFDAMNHARRHGCVWLLLDADARRADGLLTFDW